MNGIYNSMELDSANIPLAAEPEDDASIFGQFIPNTPAELSPELGKIKSHNLYLPNFTLRTFEGKMPRDAVFYDQNGTGNGMLGSCIFLKGRIRTFLPGTNRGIVSFDGSQNFKFDPHNELRHHCKADTELNFIHISLMPRFLHDLLPEDELWAEKIKNKLEKKERIIGEHFAALSLTQEKALANLFNSPMAGKLGYMMMEASIMQVLLLQLHSLFHKEIAYKGPSLNRRDLTTTYEVKEYLAKTFLEGHTIAGLAQKFCTNSNKLMSSFREAFGISIFEFISELRMDYARQMLAEEGLLVAEVSRTIGYKNPNHFSAAFKKRFGLCPSSLRN